MTFDKNVSKLLRALQRSYKKSCMPHLGLDAVRQLISLGLASGFSAHKFRIEYISACAQAIKAVREAGSIAIE